MSSQWLRWARRLSNDLSAPAIRSDLDRKTTSIACLSNSSLVLDFSSTWFASKPATPRTTGMKTAAKILERLSAFSQASRSAMTHSCLLLLLHQRLWAHLAHGTCG